MNYSDDGGHAAQCKKLKYREKEAIDIEGLAK